MAAPKIQPVQSSRWSLPRALPWLLLCGGLIAMVASIALSVEVFTRLKDPSFVPVCNLSPVLSCTSVADSSQSEAFGFPNYFIGIAGYAAIATVGAVLLAGARLKRWFWLALNFGLLLAAIFLHWLIFQALYRIGALCIFCMIVWVTSIPMLWYTFIYSLREGYIRPVPRLQKASEFMQRHHGDILLVWFLLIIVLVAKRFWYYWSTLV